MDAVQDKPKRGRPPKYAPQDRYQAHKQKQVERYQDIKDSKCQKTKQQGQIYRFAHTLLKEIWSDGLLSDSKYALTIQALYQDKQIINFK